MSRREILDLLSRKKRLKSKAFSELYDHIWQNSAPIKYKSPDHALRERLEMIKTQYRAPPN